jgi:hypothetical protein
VRALNVYLSNLDLFQTPQKLKEFAETVITIRKRYPKIEIKMRGLATAAKFMIAHTKMPESVEKIKEAGLVAVGFGIDGTPESWKLMRKKQNTIKTCTNAIRIARNVYGIRPQILEVVGFTEDTSDSLARTVDFAKRMGDETDAEIRPYLAKEDERSLLRKALAEGDSTFTDFSAWASHLTHSDRNQREVVNKTYGELLRMKNNTTVPVWVPSKKLTRAERDELSRRFPERSFTESLSAEECAELNVGSYDT